MANLPNLSGVTLGQGKGILVVQYFSLYINDLCQHLKETGNRGIFITNEIPDIICLVFADNIANCAETANNLQLQLNSISDYCKNTGMIVNLKKNEILVFRNGGPLRHYER